MIFIENAKKPSRCVFGYFPTIHFTLLFLPKQESVKIRDVIDEIPVFAGITNQQINQWQ